MHKHLTKGENLWNKGRKGEVIEIISSMNDIGIVNSFVLYALIKTELKRIDITCSEANGLLPCIVNLVKSKNDQHFLNGVLSSWVLLRMFQEVIIQTKAAQGLPGGIDLNKEDKIRKYDIFLGYLKQIRESENFKYWLNKSSKVEGVDLNKFANELDYLFRKCNF